MNLKNLFLKKSVNRVDPEENDNVEFEKKIEEMQPKFSFKFSFKELVNGHVRSVDASEEE